MPTYTTYYSLAKPLVNSPTDEDLWGGELNDNMDIIDAALHSIATSTPAASPVSAVIDYAGATEPTGWLFCYGQAVSRSTYADLFTIIGTLYGAGDGSTTFNLPDLRGRVVAGKDNMGGTSASRLTGSPTGGVTGNTLGNSGGLQGHVLTEAQLATHDHAITVASANVNGTLYGVSTSGASGSSPTRMKAGTGSIGEAIVNGNGSEGITGTFTITGDHTHTATAANAGSGSSHNNVQPTFILNKIIKY